MGHVHVYLHRCVSVNVMYAEDGHHGGGHVHTHVRESLRLHASFSTIRYSLCTRKMDMMTDVDVCTHVCVKFFVCAPDFSFHMTVFVCCAREARCERILPSPTTFTQTYATYMHAHTHV
jgi:hypothetical protein